MTAAPPSRDQKIGRVVGWVLSLSTIGFMLALFFIPNVAGFVALATWTPEQRAACPPDDRSCVVSTIPEDALPFWVALIWVGVIALGFAICWKPSRWWLPNAEARRRVKFRNFTSPDWIRIHGLIAAFVSLTLTHGVSMRKYVNSPGYWWAVAAALLIVVVATVSMRLHAFTTPQDVKRSLMLTMSAPGAFLDRRWRALQEELHPRKRRKPKAKAKAKPKAKAKAKAGD